MKPFAERMEAAREALEQAEFLVIGGGAGLSAAAGLTYGGERFRAHFADFEQKYGLSDMYEGMFFPFPTPEEGWAYRARHILVNRFLPKALPLYREILRLAEKKNSFVVTTNVDGQFQRAGFPPGRFFEVQGNYGLFQCARGCHDGLYDGEDAVRSMVRETADCRIPSALLPKCPVCGGDMAIHIRKDSYFVEDENWHDMRHRYETFMAGTKGRRVVFLELGAGYNTPGIIRFPFEQMTFANKKARLIRLNLDHPEGFGETREQTIPFIEDMREVIGEL